MRNPPADIRAGDLLRALCEHWDLPFERLTHAPVGFGDHHWTADGRWFVTAARPARSFAALAAAMRTAASLDLGFVVRPLPARDGAPIAAFPPHYALTVYPLVEGTAGEFGQEQTASDRTAMAALLAELHRATATGVPVFDPSLTGRAALEQALDELDRPWTGGPYAEPARRLLSGHGAARLREVLAGFDAQAAAHGTGTVITHGEPHPGNVLRAGSTRLLIDWDTVALAPPERDLWLALSECRRAREAYTAATGHEVSQQAMDFFRLRWQLDDISIYVQDFRSPHEDDPDTRTAWEGLRAYVAAVAR
ncbi:phosphotransferase [Nonomuraea sp. NPDC055795]